MTGNRRRWNGRAGSAVQDRGCPRSTPVQVIRRSSFAGGDSFAETRVSCVSSRFVGDFPKSSYSSCLRNKANRTMIVAPGNFS
jgi:hypothetical protein